jgi:hypothetical protein
MAHTPKASSSSGETSTEKEARVITHLDHIRQDLRDEIKERIKQRDNYLIQLTIALGIIIGISFSRVGLGKAVLAAPLVTIYFMVPILESYRVHHIITKYLREEIEPKLALLHEFPTENEWETYYNKNAVAGIRRNFFMIILWVTSILSLAYLWLIERETSEFEMILLAASAVYIGSVIWITKRFWKT